MHPVATAGTGFLLAVLWFDLMFDTQVVRHRSGAVPGRVLDSIAAYYRRVTTTARPMNRLVALAMLVTIAALATELVRRVSGAHAVALVLVAVPVCLAAARTVPSAVRLGGQHDAPDAQAALARAILRDHILCAVAVTGAMVVQLAWT